MNTKKVSSRLLLPFTLLMLLMLAVSYAFAASPKSHEATLDSSQADVIVLDSPTTIYFPPGIQLPDELLQDKPDWLELEKDGTIPEEITIPAGTSIPQTVYLPERSLSIPVSQKDGSVVWEEHTFPAESYAIGRYFEEFTKKPSDKSDTVRGTGTTPPYFMMINAATTGHCDQGVNFAYASVPTNSDPHQAFTSLPTWVPGDGSASSWNFAYDDANTYTTLCIPKSLYWIYLNPVYQANWWSGFLLHRTYLTLSLWDITYQ